MNERGNYDRVDDGRGWSATAVALGIAAAIYALSPGARHFYRHGTLPKPKRW